MLSFKKKNQPSLLRVVKFLCVMFFAVTVVSCDLAKNYTKTDRAANMEFQDFRDGLAERLPEVDDAESKSSSSVPSLQPYVSMTPESVKSMPLVSVSVNQSVPLKDILYELADQADYDLELDPNIHGSIIFSARNKPFDAVIERIANMAGLRYEFRDSHLRVEVDTPYNKTYKVDYLTFIRSNQSQVNTKVSVASEGNGANTGSTFALTSDTTSDFWAELELNLTQILGGGTTGGLKTKVDPRITAAAPSPEVAAVSPQPTEGEDGQIQVQPPEAVLNVDALPIDDGSMGAQDSGQGDDDKFAATFSLNKQAGLVNVYATEHGHKEIESYLTKLRRAVTSQVLVEAKVFEVSLNDEYINGIEWQVLNNQGNGIVRFLEGNDNLLGAITAPTGTIADTSNFALGYLGGDISAFVKAISGFGTVRALASPRLTVLNNQSAVLNVATNRIWFDLDVSQETDADTNLTTTQIDTEIKSVPEGVLINVQPSINLDDRTISMFLRPTVTRIVGTVQDPAAENLNITSAVPEVNVQEIDTVVKVNSGQPIVMGGLLQDRISDIQQGVPVLGEVPILGSLFKTQKDLISKTELVIFLKATLIESPDQTIDNTDKDIYRAFSGDRHPLKL